MIRRRKNRGSYGRLVLFLAIAVLGWLFTAHSLQSRPLEPIRHIRSGIPGVDVIEIDPTAAEIRPVIANGNGEYFSDMVKRLKPTAAINGTFYSAEMKPLGDILIDGKLKCRGHYPNAFAVTNDGKIKLIRGTKQHIDWSGCRHGIAAGPRLVHNGIVELKPNDDGFTKRSLTIAATRTGIGITKDGNLLLVTTSREILLQDFAEVMVKLGATEALNVDGGGARGLLFKDKIYANPYLLMTNILAVYEKKSSK